MQLTAEQYRHLRDLLLRCAPVADPAELRALFAGDPRLRPWRHQVPAGAPT